jgi:hypothetical protein
MTIGLLPNSNHRHKLNFHFKDVLRPDAGGFSREYRPVAPVCILEPPLHRRTAGVGLTAELMTPDAAGNRCGAMTHKNSPLGPLHHLFHSRDTQRDFQIQPTPRFQLLTNFPSTVRITNHCKTTALTQFNELQEVDPSTSFRKSSSSPVSEQRAINSIHDFKTWLIDSAEILKFGWRSWQMWMWMVAERRRARYMPIWDEFNKKRLSDVMKHFGHLGAWAEVSDSREA